MIEKVKELAAANGWWMSRQFENPANPEYHSKTTAQEILADARARVADEAHPLGGEIGDAAGIVVNKTLGVDRQRVGRRRSRRRGR